MWRMKAFLWFSSLYSYDSQELKNGSDASQLLRSRQTNNQDLICLQRLKTDGNTWEKIRKIVEGCVSHWWHEAHENSVIFGISLRFSLDFKTSRLRQQRENKCFSSVHSSKLRTKFNWWKKQLFPLWLYGLLSSTFDFKKNTIWDDFSLSLSRRRCLKLSHAFHLPQKVFVHGWKQRNRAALIQFWRCSKRSYSILMQSHCECMLVCCSQPRGNQELSQRRKRTRIGSRWK